MSRKKSDQEPAEVPGSLQGNVRVNEQEPDKRARLRREIVKGQSELEEAVLDLKDVVEEKIERVDIRRRIAVNPWPWLAGGFAAGLILGLRSR